MYLHILYYSCNSKEMSISSPGLAGSQQGKRSVKDHSHRHWTQGWLQFGLSGTQAITEGFGYRLACAIRHYDNMSALT